jgi:hypothetical protein
MYERGQRVIVEGYNGRRAVLRVWDDRGRGVALSTEEGYKRLLAGDSDAPLVGFPRRDIVRVTASSSEPEPPSERSPTVAPA